jgi:peptidoglycan/xylan/chitin deacetylase (PgdA/CDA1 family)
MKGSLFKHWKPAFSLWLFALLFAGCILATLYQPALWKYTLSIVLVAHASLSIAGLIPKSRLLGANITRLPDEAARNGCVAITLDDGPDPAITPQVLDILDTYQVRATFFCIGERAARHPELCREIIRRGHAIENHSQSHPWNFSLMSPWRIHREIQQAQATLSEISGQTPLFFRPTAGLRNPALDPILAHCQLRLCSWSRRGFDTRVKDADAVFKSLTDGLKGGDILLLHDGNSARDVQNNPVILNVLPRLLEYITQQKLHPITLRAAMPS